MVMYSRSSIQKFDNWRFWIRKTNALINLVNEQNDIDKICLYAKDLNEPKNEYFLKKRKNAGMIQMHLLSVPIR